MINIQKRRFLIIFFIIFFFFIFILSIIKILNEYSEYQEINEDIEVLKRNVNIEDDENSIINWEELKKKNPDIVGWIKIDGTKIDYPILKDENTFYLNHSYNKTYNANGSIFILDNNLCESNETVIYGHNRLNGIMFSELSKYLDKDFFDKHLEFFIYTPEKTYKARVFSAYSTNVFSEKENLNLLNFNAQIDYYKSKSKFKVETGNVEKIVKLSTCSYLNNRKRVTEERYYIIASIE